MTQLLPTWFAACALGLHAGGWTGSGPTNAGSVALLHFRRTAGRSGYRPWPTRSLDSLYALRRVPFASGFLYDTTPLIEPDKTPYYAGSAVDYRLPPLPCLAPPHQHCLDGVT